MAVAGVPTRQTDVNGMVLFMKFLVRFLVEQPVAGTVAGKIDWPLNWPNTGNETQYGAFACEKWK